MAFISKTNISTSNIIEASHITGIIDALDGTTATQISMTGAVTASNARITGSFTGSFVGGLTGTATTASFAVTASYALTTATSAQGATGAQGASGAGTQGAAGSNGSQGATGTQGATGATGAAGSISYTTNPNGILWDNGGTVEAGLSPIQQTSPGPGGVWTGDIRGTLNLSALGTASPGSGLVLPTTIPNNPIAGSIYVDITGNRVKVFDGGTWRNIAI